MKRLSAQEQAQLELLRDTVFEGQTDLFELLEEEQHSIAGEKITDDDVTDTP